MYSSPTLARYIERRIFSHVAYIIYPDIIFIVAELLARHFPSLAIAASFSFDCRHGQRIGIGGKRFFTVDKQAIIIVVLIIKHNKPFYGIVERRRFNRNHFTQG